MSLLDRFNPIENIIVSEDMVNRWEKNILIHLQSKPYVHLQDELSRIINIELRYNRENYENEFKNFTEKISNFMAFQEALFNLMCKGEIMPVKLPNQMFGGRNYIRVSYIESQGMSTLRGETDINIPILVYETFMLKPSLKNN